MHPLKTVVLVGTLDTKGVEYEFARNRFQKAGLKTILINAGIIGQSSILCLISSWANTCPAFLKSSAISSVAEKISSDLMTSTFLRTAFEAANNPEDNSCWASFGKFLSTLKSNKCQYLVN